MLVLISFLGLHSCVDIFMRGMFRGGDMCLGSLFWVTKSFPCMMFLYSVCCFLVCECCICIVLYDSWDVIGSSLCASFFVVGCTIG